MAKFTPPQGALPATVAGGCAGLINGFFGGGGGMVLVPLLTKRLSQEKAFATSIAIILPLCILSVGIYTHRGHMDFQLAAPYLLGGLLGGLIGGKIFRKMSMLWLRRLFALLILYGAWRALLC